MKAVLSPTPGYYRQPTLHGDDLVFVAEDDLWHVSAGGGLARRLTSGRGRASDPVISPDGQTLAYIATEEGHAEAWVTDPRGGPPRRLTWFGSGRTQLIGWDRHTGDLLVTTCVNQPFLRYTVPNRVPLDGGEPVPLPWGHARHVDLGEPDVEGRRPVVLTRHQDDLAYWRRYRGGRAGVMWIDADGDGTFEPLLHNLGGSVARGTFMGDRVLFLSDHEGIGNLYTCTPGGEGVTRLTHHDDFTVRYPRVDGERVVYMCGADLWIVEPGAEPRMVEIDYHGPRTDRQRRFPFAGTWLESFDLHPEGHTLAVGTRGKPFTMGLWEGGVRQHGAPQGVRHRLCRYLPSGEHLVCVSDAGGEEAIELLPLTDEAEHARLDHLDLGFITALAVAPAGQRLAVRNQRCELILVDLEPEEATATVMDTSDHGRFSSGAAFSHDGRWLAWGAPLGPHRRVIRVANLDTGDVHDVTSGEFRDVNPCFDPDGRYIYYVSYREFDPVYDSMQFDLNFPRGMKLCLVTLREDVDNPLVPKPKPVVKSKKAAAKKSDPDPKDDGGDADEDDGGDAPASADLSADAATPSPMSEGGGDGEGDDSASDDGDDGADDKNGDGASADKDDDGFSIDVDGILHRSLVLPIGEGRFGRLSATSTHLFFTSYKVEGSKNRSWRRSRPPARATLKKFSLEDRAVKEVTPTVTTFKPGQGSDALVIRSANKLRVVPHTFAAKGKSDKKDRKNGWVDLGRISLEVDPGAEWRQMYRETWRLMRDNFWVEDMSGVDWDAAYARYLPLVERVATRREFSDVVWQLQGETGTSHAYELGGDYPSTPRHNRGFLGADTAPHPATGGFEVTHIVRADSWDPKNGSPLARVGSGVSEGDVILAVDGRPVTGEDTLDALLVNRANAWVELTVVDGDGEGRRHVSVKALATERPIRYRAWVDANRARVHAASGGRLGYVHVPNMGPAGYAEFHRGFLAEVHNEGLVIDVRFNGGGHVSQRLIEKLARRRVGYDKPRYGRPHPYPAASVVGPLVCLTNEYAGSDGDIFSHVFKLYELGPLVGKRTWGGVIGISPRHKLVDNSIVTQPEFSYWFEDVGFGVENYGTDPDVEVDVAPHDYANGEDPQLERAIALAMEALEADPPQPPDLSERPRLGREGLGE